MDFLESLRSIQGLLKRRVITDKDLIIVQEMETRFHSRAAGTFIQSMENQILRISVPGTELWDIGIRIDMKGRKNTIAELTNIVQVFQLVHLLVIRTSLSLVVID